MKSLIFLIRPFIEYCFNITGYPRFFYHLLFPTILIISSIIFADSFNHILDIIYSSKTFLSFLAGFSFAAIIALPSINSSALNKKMYGNKLNSSKAIPINWKTYKNGVKVYQHITRKQFMSFLLSYICFMSTILMGLSFLKYNGLIGNIIIHYFNDTYYVNILIIGSSYIVKFIYLWSLFSIIINVLYIVQYFSKSVIEDT